MDTVIPDPTKITPDTLLTDARLLGQKADVGSEQLRQERASEFDRRQKEGTSDTAAYMKATDDLAGAIGNREKVAMPNPNLGPMLDPQQTQNFAFGMIALSLMGAIGGRQHWGAATAALDGFLKGMKDGAEEQMKEKKAEFDREFKVALEKQKEADRVYEDILKSKTLSMNKVAELIRIHATAHQDWDMEAKARQHDFDGMYQRMNQDMQAAEKMIEFKANFDQRAERIGIERQKLAQTGGAGASAWTPEALDAIAETVVAGQPMPAMGSGTAAMAARGKVWQRVAEIAKERGIPLRELPAARAQFSADKGSLAKLTQMADAVKAFENTAIKNGDKLVELGDKVDKTGIPVIERWIRAGRKEIAGDPLVNDFNAQMTLFGTEVAKILTNPTLSGQLTDNAREEVSKFAPASASAAQIRSLVTLLKGDFERRRQAIDDQKREITERLRNIGTRAGEGGTSNAAKTVNWDDLR